ncbi:MAG TPA: hypothetical protein ENI23_00475 [bacterium]|nr:hypothetical protein [bacterium]
MANKRPAVKLKRFQKLLLSNPTLTPTEVAFQVYDCKNRNVATVIASQSLAKLNITMADLMNRMGLSDEEDMNDLKRLRKAQRIQSCDVYVDKDENGKYVVNENSNDFIEVDDSHIQLRALELTFKLKKKLNGDTHINVNQNYVQIYRPESYSQENVETASRPTDRSL